MVSRSSVNAQDPVRREFAVAEAVASVRAEGLEPSASALRRLGLFAEGKISITQLHQATLADVKARTKSNKV